MRLCMNAKGPRLEVESDGGTCCVGRSWPWQVKWWRDPKWWEGPKVVILVAERRTEVWRAKVAGMHREGCSWDG